MSSYVVVSTKHLGPDNVLGVVGTVRLIQYGEEDVSSNDLNFVQALKKWLTCNEDFCKSVEIKGESKINKLIETKDLILAFRGKIICGRIVTTEYGDETPYFLVEIGDELVDLI